MRDKNTTFMEKYSLQVVAACLAVLLAGALIYKIEAQKKDFDATVRKAYKQTAGYDVQFIEMVNRMEDLLAERASFGYAGSRDPMTGATRAVAARPQVAVRQTAPRRTAPVAAAVEEAAPVKEEVDPVRLTAIIFDNTRGNYTAIVMDGTRSQSVGVGDRVIDRRVTRITSEEIHMENDRARYIYNILGGNTKVLK